MINGKRLVPAVLMMSSTLTAGCLADHGSVVKGLAADLGESPTPRVSRTQQPEQASFKKLPGDPPIASIRKGSDVTVRAWVNGHPIFDDEVLAMVMPILVQIEQLPPDVRAAEQAKAYNSVLDAIVEREILYQDAVATFEKFQPKALDQIRKAASDVFEKQIRSARERSKLTEEEFRVTLAKQGMSLRNLRRKIEHEFIGREFVRGRIMPLLDSKIGHKEIRDYYEEHRNEFQRLDLVEWQDVFIAVTPQRPTLAQARAFAEELVARAKRGEEFAKFLEYDDGDSRVRNGMGYGQRRGDIRPPELEKYLFDMREGEVGPPVELTTGVHVFRVVRREQAGQIPFNEDTQKAIRKKLREEMADREYKAYVRDLRVRALIEICETN